MDVTLRDRRPAVCSWRLPWLLSLGLHGLAALFVAVRSSGDAGCEARAVDTRVEPSREIRLSFDQPGPAPASESPAKASTPPVAPEPPREAVETSVAGGTNPAEVAPTIPGAPTPAPASEAGGGRGGDTTAFFQVGVRGRSVVYVIDRSSSMGFHGCLDAAKRELLASIERLPPDCCFQVILYNRLAEPLRLGAESGLVAASQENKGQVFSLVSALGAEGGTEHFAALRRALLLQPDVIFFLTDADDLKLEQVRLITHLNQGRTAIHTFELTTANRANPDMPLQQLARYNHGVYRALALDAGL